MTKAELEKEAEAEADKVIIGSGMDRASVIHLKHLLVTMYIQGATEATKELKAQIEKMKWHKIADGDIPKVTGDYITNIGVLTYDHYGNNIYKWHTPFCEACDYGDEVDEDEVIAWCEIPKYTKEMKENG